MKQTQETLRKGKEEERKESVLHLRQWADSDVGGGDGLGMESVSAAE